MIHTFHHDPIKITWPKLKLRTVQDQRLYTLPNGKEVPSITTILSATKNEGLIRWQKRVGPEETEKVKRVSATRGKSFHAIVETYLRTGDQSVALKGAMPDQIESFINLKPILHRIDNIRGIELPVYSEILGCAGTIDLVADFDGIESIIDFKTARNPKERSYIDNYFVQTTGYAAMLNARINKLYKNLVILINVFGYEPQVFQETLNRSHGVALQKVIETYYNAQ